MTCKDAEKLIPIFIKNELNETDENVSELINDIINDKIELTYVNSYIFEKIMNDHKDELI